jgi:hypothetical protein
MTQEEWLTSADPYAMLNFLGERVGGRKLRLFACACVRQVWANLLDEKSQRAVEVAERFADGQASAEELAGAAQQAEELTRGVGLRVIVSDPGWAASRGAAFAAAGSSSSGFVAAARVSAISAAPWAFDPDTGTRLHSGDPAARAAAWALQADLLRCVFGNPFQPVAVDRAWLEAHDGAVHSLAATIYEARRFDDLPILADALEDAGCTHEAIVSHCRAPVEHVRGCWVVDALLGWK